MEAPGPQETAAARSIDEGALHVEIGSEAESYVVTLRGELDMECAPTLQDELSRLFTSSAATVTVDLADLQFIDSSGLRCLLNVTKGAADSGTKLSFLRPGGQVEQVLEITKIRQALPIAA